MFLFVLATATVSNAKNKILVRNNTTGKSIVKFSVNENKDKNVETISKLEDKDILLTCCQKGSASADLGDGYTLTVSTTSCASSCALAYIMATNLSNDKLAKILIQL